MPADEEIMKQMDEAAELAKADLQENLGTWTARELVGWWAKWYIRAGHKRLGRLLVTIAKDMK